MDKKALSDLVLQGRFIEPFIKNNLKGESVNDKLHSVANTLDMKE